MAMLEPIEHTQAISWSERDLPQRVRTKHVHGLHPYFGKFVPQLVDYFLTRTLQHAKMVCDPFCGSGTTLVEANSNGKPSLGVDVSPFNVLLCRVKTREHDIAELKREAADIMDRVLKTVGHSTTLFGAPPPRRQPIHLTLTSGSTRRPSSLFWYSVN